MDESHGQTGGRIDWSFVNGAFTIGGDGANRNFHGKVASMVVTTLKLNSPMPTDAEIEAMVTDPVKWVDDYKVGNDYRVADAPNFEAVYRRTRTAMAHTLQVQLGLT